MSWGFFILRVYYMMNRYGSLENEGKTIHFN